MTAGHIRASSLPTIFACPASIHGDQVIDVQEDTGPARLGTAVHAVMANVLQGAEENASEIAGRYGVEPSDVEHLVDYGKKAWEELRAYCGELSVETELDEAAITGTGVLRGHADFYSVHNGSIVIGDWKSGRVETDARQQMAGYAYLVSQLHPDIPEVVAFVIFLRHKYYQVYRFTRTELLQWRQQLLDVLSRDNEYHPGDACLYCKRRYDCPARHNMIRAAITELGDEGAVLSASLYRRAQMVAQIVEDFKSRMKEYILINGPVTDETGTVEVVTESRDDIDAQIAWPHMISAGLTQEEIGGSIKIRKTELLNAIASHAPARGKSAAKAAFMEALNDAGAVKKIEIQKLKESKNKTKEEN